VLQGGQAQRGRTSARSARFAQDFLVMCPPGKMHSTEHTTAVRLSTGGRQQGRLQISEPGPLHYGTGSTIARSPISPSYPIPSHHWTGGGPSFSSGLFSLFRPPCLPICQHRRHTRRDTVPDGRQRQKVVLLSRPRCTCPWNTIHVPDNAKTAAHESGAPRAKKKIPPRLAL
jgi:hypothetical protein